MIRVEIKPRQDNLFDIYVGDEGDEFLNSNQGYENVEDAIAIARRLWPPLNTPDDLPGLIGPVFDAVCAVITSNAETVVMRVTYRNGKTMTEQLR